MAECIICGDDYNDKRKELGYNTCLSCGASDAHEQIIEKSKRVMPLFNKGGLQYLTDGEDLKTIGKKN